MQQEINMKVGNKAPSDYFSLLIENFNNSDAKFSGLESHEQLSYNLKMHCIPEMILSNNASNKSLSTSLIDIMLLSCS